MLQTYKAILRGNYLEWSGDAPKGIEQEQAVEVHVTILRKATSSAVVAQGKRMAEALERLAAINALSEITDPSAWQREQRQDRSLPDRDV
jgi:predicted phosphoadenosine phosphosulfate sulfurtransferase